MIPARTTAPAPAPFNSGNSMPEALWAIRKIEEATVDAYAASTPEEQREGDLLIARLTIALGEPADPEFCCHG